MFDRCNPNAAAVVEAAIAAARRFGHDYIGTEHLLLAIAERRDVLPAPVASMLPPADAIRSQIATVIGESAHQDADVLRAVGIDLEQVRDAVLRTFGADAVERLGQHRVHRPWRPWRSPSKRCTSLLAGTMMVAPRLKRVLERAWREAQQRHQPSIMPCVLLLGIVEVEDAMANRLLRHEGIDPRSIRMLLVAE